MEKVDFFFMAKAESVLDSGGSIRGIVKESLTHCEETGKGTEKCNVPQ